MQAQEVAKSTRMVLANYPGHGIQKDILCLVKPPQGSVGIDQSSADAVL